MALEARALQHRQHLARKIHGMRGGAAQKKKCQNPFHALRTGLEKPGFPVVLTGRLHQQGMNGRKKLKKPQKIRDPGSSCAHSQNERRCSPLFCVFCASLRLFQLDFLTAP
ncbi:MAG TPA: hypothetical protein PK490_11955 [Prosthecobacter sp.]|nr:hypothetical protein [Prosthecobacter sp.]